MHRFTLLTVLALAACIEEDVVAPGSDTAATIAPISPDTLPAAARMGANLDMPMDWTTEWPFKDLFRESRAWVSNRAGAAWGEGGRLDLTPEQWVRSLDAGQWATTLILTDPSRNQPGGDYVMVWDGDGDIGFDESAGLTRLSSSANRATMRLAKGMPALISLRRTNPLNPVRNIRVFAASNEADYTTRPFSTDFLRVIRPFGVIRFMNWQQTQKIPPRDWANRATAAHATWSGPWGVPVETMVALANELRADAWFSMPHNATDEYMQRFAMLVRERLAPDRRVYVELSNELWNGIFPQSGYAREQGQSLGLSQDPFQAALRWQSQRSVEMFAIWRAAFAADSSRVIRVMASQASNPWTAEQLLPWRDAYRVTDVLAIAPYFGGRFGGRDGSAEASMTESQLLDLLAQEIETTTRGFIESNANVARRFGVRLVAYEGGQHLVSADVRPQYEPAVTKLFIAANRHARMGDLYRRYFEIWYAAGGDLFMTFVPIAGPSKYGSWGNLEYAHQDPLTSPKYQAVLSAASKWGR